MNALKKAETYNQLSHELKTKFILYEAVSERNFEKIIELTNLLLPKREINPSPDNDYYLMLSMMSYIALNQNNNAKLVWERYNVKTDIPLKQRLLASYAYLNL